MVQQNTSRRTVIIAFCLARQTCCRSQFLWRCFIHHACLLTWPHSLCKLRPKPLQILCSFAALGNRLLHNCRRRSTCHAPKFWPRCVCMLALCCRSPQMFVFHIADYSSQYWPSQRSFITFLLGHIGSLGSVCVLLTMSASFYGPSALITSNKIGELYSAF